MTPGKRSRARLYLLIAIFAAISLFGFHLEHRGRVRRSAEAQRERRLTEQRLRELEARYGQPAAAVIYVVNGPGEPATIEIRGEADWSWTADGARVMSPAGKAVPPDEDLDVAVFFRERERVHVAVHRGGATDRYDNVKPGTYLLLLSSHYRVNWESVMYASDPKSAWLPPPRPQSERTAAEKGLHKVSSATSRVFAFDESPPAHMTAAGIQPFPVSGGIRFTRFKKSPP